jgi:acetyl esterase
MKIHLIIYLSLLTATLSAQSKAFEIRERIANGVESLNISPAAVNKIINKEISGDDFSVKVRLYYPSNQDSLPILYFIHGGGWIGGSIDTHDNFSRHLANQANSIVVAVDNRRPPEYKFPIPLDDCYFILNWI